MDANLVSLNDAPKGMRPLMEGVQKLQRGVAVIKRILCEGKLTPWAKKELAQARNAPRSSYVSLDEI